MVRHVKEDRGTARRGASGALLVLLALAGCGGGAERGPYSTLLITLDTTRADALSCYGRYEGVTPNLDRLAAESVLYEAAHTVAPMTLPAHASILTGLYPIRHSVRVNGMWALPDAAETVAEAARASGLQTGAILASLVLDARFGLNQGFDTYSVPPPRAQQRTSEFPERSAKEVIDAAVTWLRTRDRGRRFLLWVHLFDPHWPPTSPLPLPFDVPSPRREYLGEVARMDREIGRLLDELDDEGALDETFVVVVGDHGEGLGEHGEPTHAMYLYEGTLRVPFLLRYPDGYRAGERSREIVSVADAQPTMMEAMGLTPDPSLDGLSLFRRPVPPDRGVYFESYEGYLAYGWSQTAGWLDARGKYVHSSSPQLFALDVDPHERNDLFAERADDAERYRTAIAALASRPALTPVNAGASEELVAEIQDLGYGALGRADEAPPHPLEKSDRPCPVEKLEEFRLTSHAGALLNLGRSEEAIAILEKIARESPGNVTALQKLTTGLLQVQRFADALPLLERLVRLRPFTSAFRRNLSYALRMRGRTDEAVEALWAAVELDPHNESFFEELQWILRDRPAEAAEYAARRRRLLE